MSQDKIETSLIEIRRLLFHLQGEVVELEQGYARILRSLKKFENACDLDDLTGLLRRRAFFRKWEAMLEGCRHSKTSCGVILIDIDHFKRVNDTHGHPTGDEVLKRVSALLKQYESQNCLVCRLGGEEFAVAVRGTDAEVLGIAEMIRRQAERMHGPIVESDGKLSSRVHWKCTLSAGMASVNKLGFDASRLLKAADEALYSAKSKGRNQVAAA